MSRSSCETCGCPLEPVHGDHVGHEERSDDDACIGYLKAEAERLRGLYHDESISLRLALCELADASEEAASSDPDMPSHKESGLRFDTALDAARALLDQKK